MPGQPGLRAGARHDRMVQRENREEHDVVDHVAPYGPCWVAPARAGASHRRARTTAATAGRGRRPSTRTLFARRYYKDGLNAAEATARGDHRNRRCLGVRRRARQVLGRDQDRPERHARDYRIRRLDLSLPGGRAGARHRHVLRRGARRRAGSARNARRSQALLAGGAVRRGGGARSLERRGPQLRRAQCRRDHRQRRRRHRRRRTPVPGLLPERRPARHAVCDRGRHLRHGVERDLDCAGPARHQPRPVDRLHELDRRARLRLDVAAAG